MRDINLCGKLISVRNKVNSNSQYLYRTMFFDEQFQVSEHLFTATDIKKFIILEDMSLQVGLQIPHELNGESGLCVKLNVWKTKNEQLPEISQNKKQMISKNAANLVADLAINGEWVECVVFIKQNLLTSSNNRVNSLKKT